MMGKPGGPGWRFDVRDRIAEILMARVPDVASRVHRARVWPVDGGKKPGLLVYGYAEQKRLTSGGGWEHQFEVTCGFAVTVLTEGPDARVLEAECEDLARQVERVILTAPELFSPETGVVERCSAVGTQITAEQKERGVEVNAVLTFEMTWAEVFRMVQPDTSECETVTFQHRSHLTPS